MSYVTNSSRAAARRLGGIALLFCAWAAAPAWAETQNTVTVMTRNMDAGTDLHFIVGATDQASLIEGAAATLGEIQASGIPERAARLADEIGAQKPDLIALQEVTLWRTGPLLQPPATGILYDQLTLLLAELAKRNLYYGIVAIQTEFDSEIPVPAAGVDLRMTDRDVILARLDLPQSQFDIFNAQTHRFKAVLSFGTPALGQVSVPCGWMSVDVIVNGSKFRFVNTHMQSTIPGLPEAEQTQLAQANELIAGLLAAGMPVVLAGDFNANAEPGPEYTGTVQEITRAGFADTWRTIHPGDPGYTWPLFGEDEASGPTVPNERIDLIFTSGFLQGFFGRDASVVSAERTGMSQPWASDHAGVVVKLRLR